MRRIRSEVSRFSRIVITVSSLTACCILLTVQVSAQQKPAQHKISTVHHTNKSSTRPKSEKLPHSMPSSAVPGTASGSSSGSSRELNRLEQSTMNQSRASSRRSSGASLGSSRPATTLRSNQHSAPINFTYHGAANSQAAHRNPAK